MVKKYRGGRQEGVFFEERFYVILDLLGICFSIKNKVLLFVLLREG